MELGLDIEDDLDILSFLSLLRGLCPAAGRQQKRGGIATQSYCHGPALPSIIRCAQTAVAFLIPSSAKGLFCPTCLHHLESPASYCHRCFGNKLREARSSSAQ